MAPKPLTSAQNPKIKRLLALQKDSSMRRETGLFVVEGRRELERCLASGFELDSLFLCPELTGRHAPDATASDATPSMNGRGHATGTTAFDATPSLNGRDQTPGATASDATPSLNGRGHAPGKAAHGTDLPESLRDSGAKVFEVSKEVYERIAYRGGTEGVIAEVRSRSLGLGDLSLPENPLIVVLEAVEKPGNLGAVLRSADAAGADALLVCDPLTDLWNPNVIRSSTGTCFTVPTVACTSAEAIAWLRSRGIRILTAQLQDSALYYDCDLRQPTALVFGTESTGLSQAWRDAASAHIRLPMLGAADSLNVSVSASILLYEALRQRRA